MSAVLLKPDTVQAVHAAAAVKAKASAEVTRLQLRLNAIELRAEETLIERARHQAQVTTALLDDSPMPKALPPVPVEPDAALAIVRKELKTAEQVLVEMTGDHRSAQVHHVEHLRDKAVADYREALASFTTALRYVAALDRILARTGLTNALPPTFRRLSIPALRGDEQVSPGLSVDGNNFFGKPELDERERQARQSIQQEVGPLPF